MSDEPVLDLRADKCVSSICCCDIATFARIVWLLGLLDADQLKYGTHHRTKSDPADEKEGRPAKRLNLPPRDSRDNGQVSFHRYNCSKCLGIVTRR